MNDTRKIRIATIAGTVRPGNYTSKALAVVIDELGKHPDVHVDAIDLTALDLQPPGRPSSADVQELPARIQQATAVVLATPEYHGTFSAVTKLFLENLGFPSALAGKPVALLGVAAGQIGAIKSLEHLRSVASHVGAHVIPSSVSIAGVQALFDADGKILDPGTEKRLRGLAVGLIDHIRGTVCPRIILEEMARLGDKRWMELSAR